MKNAPITFIFGLLFLTACQKEPILTPTTPPIVEEEMATDRATAFEFTIQSKQCLSNKVSIFVDIENPQLYGYRWEVNDDKAGHLLALEGCHCGTSAAVTVMRFSDGVRIRRSVSLPSCGDTTPPIAPEKEAEQELVPDTIQPEVN